MFSGNIGGCDCCGGGGDPPGPPGPGWAGPWNGSGGSGYEVGGYLYRYDARIESMIGVIPVGGPYGSVDCSAYTPEMGIPDMYADVARREEEGFHVTDLKYDGYHFTFWNAFGEPDERGYQQDNDGYYIISPVWVVVGFDGDGPIYGRGTNENPGIVTIPYRYGPSLDGGPVGRFPGDWLSEDLWSGMWCYITVGYSWRYNLWRYSGR